MHVVGFPESPCGVTSEEIPQVWVGRPWGLVSPLSGSPGYTVDRWAIWGVQEPHGASLSRHGCGDEGCLEESVDEGVTTPSDNPATAVGLALPDRQLCRARGKRATPGYGKGHTVNLCFNVIFLHG